MGLRQGTRNEESDAIRAPRHAQEMDHGCGPEPVAIVGIGCRFPGGANDVRSFWKLLAEGRSGIREVPADRWNLDRYYSPDPAASGTMVTRWGGFVDNLDMFDARFWAISPREAVRMDPQQRWLLEVAWESLEDAGIAPLRLRGRNIGVFVGIAGNDYGGLQLPNGEAVDAYTNSGSTLSIAANRVSYMFDLKGPSLSVDTACSSSLVAVWMACRSIWSRDCEGALAGGVNALIAPHASIGFSKAAMVSPTGRCFAFDHRANGYVRAEGAGMVYLKPLAAARADGDRIYALIRAAIVNQDGRTSSMTVPSVEGQAVMLREAYKQAGIAPSRVAYVEAHGTGTPVGDPIEAMALGRVLGEGRACASRCLIGSVKTNIGHLEAGSGIAGLIKAAMVLHERAIPASLNYEQANPHIPFDELKLEVASRFQPLEPSDGERAVVAVNSFGFGGTNAHVVLEDSPATSAPERPSTTGCDRPFLLPVSARDEVALRRYVDRYRELLADTSESIADVCASAGERKEHHPHRIVVIGQTRDELRDRAAAWLQGSSTAGVVSGRTTSHAPVVFVFTGQGAQWWAMGRQLFAREPIVRQTIERIDARLQTLAGWSLVAELQRFEAESNIDRTDVAQPAIFALQMALVELWKTWGIEPAKVIGHSVGEVAAACCAGVYSVEDGATIIFHRSRLQHATAGSGRMLAVALSEAEARHAIGAVAGHVDIGAVNSPRLVTLTGDGDALGSIAARLQDSGVFARWLAIPYAFHSRHMDPLRDELLRALAHMQPRASGIPFISTVTGEAVAGEELDAEYWWKNVRQPVLFGPAIARLAGQGDDTFLEIGPHPALESSLKECLAEGSGAHVFHSLRRDTDDSRELLTNLAGLHIVGIPVEWRAVNRGTGAAVRLPHYPWNRESFWLESRRSAQARLAPPVHPLLDLRVAAATPTWQFTLDVHRLPYLTDHRIWGSIVLPASAYAEIGLALARLVFDSEPHAVEDLEIAKALFVTADEPSSMQVVFNAEDKSFGIYRATSNDGWDLHARGTLARVPRTEPPRVDLDSIRDRLPDHFDHEQCCREFAIRGYEFGPSFQEVRNLWRIRGEALAEVEAPAFVASEIGRYCFHPALLDACFHAFIGLRVVAPDARPEDDLFLPQSIRRIHLHCERPPTRLWAHARLISDTGASRVADILIYDEHGERVADVIGFTLDDVGPPRSAVDLDECCYQFDWEPRRLRGSGVDEPCSFPDPEDLVTGATSLLPDIRERHGVDEYFRGFVPEAKAVTAHLIHRACASRGWRFVAGQRFGFEAFVTTLQISPEHQRVTRALLRDLVDLGSLRPHGEDTWEVVRGPDLIDAEAALDGLAERYPTCAAEIDVLRRTGLNLAAVLSGDVDPLDLLFPGGSQDLLARFYTEGAAFPADLELIRRLANQAVASLPPGRALRVLEAGAGTGAFTGAVLPVLPPDRTEYLFTDVGPAFLTTARRRFADLRFVEYQLFDVERDPRTQNIPAGGFDLVLASDVLHATADVRQTLRNLHSCVSPGGLLIFLELVSQRSVRFDVMFGLLKGFWRFTDTDVRRDSALLDRSTWTALVRKCGFADVASIGCTTDEEVEHATFIARATAGPAAAPAGRSGKSYLLFADEQGIADVLNDRLQRHGHRTMLVRRDDAFAGEPALVANGFDGVIHCWSLDRPAADDMTIEQLRDAQHTSVMSAFRVIRAVADRPTRVWFVTRNVHCVEDGDGGDGLASAPLIGLTRVANNEHGCRFALIDLGSCRPAEAAEHLANEVTLAPDGEFEVAYRRGIRHALRLNRVQVKALPKRVFNAVRRDRTVAAFRLQTDRPGVLANLTLHEAERRAPGPNEMEVRTRAGGINFRDVMKALGTHPGRPIDLLWFGDDFSGTVERVGANVDRFHAGDEVAGMAPYAFQAYATTDPRIAFRKPAKMSFAEAATIPTVFLTAHYALNHLARMQPGERILIHAGTGGVGLAAIQVAKQLSLEIFATAGTPEKRRFLADMGVPHVMNSRTLEFADEIMAITSGRGVDAVLNSLAGDFIPRSLSVLAPFGRFLEIGKIDVYRNSRIGLQPLRNNVSYFVIDVSQYPLEKPGFVARMFAELSERFEAGEYRALPFTTFPVTQAQDAFRFMAQAKHVGKNVLTFDLDEIPIAFTTDERRRFRAHATYLVTGGTSGFGLELARWIARHGGRHLVLLSRSGPRDPDALRAIEELRAEGATVIDARADVTRREDVERVVHEIGATLPPLKGVFHAAMVLDDEFLTELDESRVWRVLEPKMAGAWNLHVATRGCSLDHFVSFSSFSAVLAMPKQSSYNAGNCFLDALAHYRQRLGLPALTVDWGAILGAGFVERNQKTREFLDKIGFGALRVDEALRLLDRLMIKDVAQVVASRANWRSVVSLSPYVAASNTFAAVARDPDDTERGGSWESRIRSVGADRRARLVEDFIAAQVAGVFGTPEQQLDRDTALTNVGLDSLMTVELTNRVERELGVRIPMGNLLSGPSIRQLAMTLLGLLGPVLGTREGGAAVAPTVARRPAPSRDSRHIIVIRPGGDEPPLFAFHPVGGGVSIYASLASQIAGDVPVYGVESRLLGGAAREFGDLDEMVTAYASEVRGVHSGPYRLFGFSLGGYLAARVAEVLQDEGHLVEFVGSVEWDAARRNTTDEHRAALTRLSVAAYLFLAQDTGIVRALPERHLRDEIVRLVDSVMSAGPGGSEVFFRWAVENDLIVRKSLEDAARQYLSRFEQHCLLLRCEPRQPVFRAPLVVWRARDGFGSGIEAWEHAGDSATAYVLEGDHLAWSRPPVVSTLAQQLGDALTRGALSASIDIHRG